MATEQGWLTYPCTSSATGTHFGPAIADKPDLTRDPPIHNGEPDPDFQIIPATTNAEIVHNPHLSFGWRRAGPMAFSGG